MGGSLWECFVAGTNLMGMVKGNSETAMETGRQCMCRPGDDCVDAGM